MKLTTFLAGLLAVALVTESVTGQQSNQADVPSVAVAFTQPQGVVNTIVQAIHEEVTRAFPNAVIRDFHASGDESLYGSTVLSAIRSRPDVLVAVTTPIAQQALAQTRGRLPLVFAGITDPVGAKLVQSIDHPVLSTGSSDLCPFEPMVRLARTLYPNARVLGLPYNPGDQPAVFGREQLRTIAPKYGFTVADLQTSSLATLGTEVSSLARRADIILVSSDNLTINNSALVASSAASQGKPTVGCDEGSAKNGAAGAVSVDYKDVGTAAGERVVEVLRGAKPGDLPVKVLNTAQVIVNRESACRTGANLRAAGLAHAQFLHPEVSCNPSRKTSGRSIVMAAVVALVLLLGILFWLSRRRAAVAA